MVDPLLTGAAISGIFGFLTRSKILLWIAGLLFLIPFLVTLSIASIPWYVWVVVVLVVLVMLTGGKK